MKRTALFGLLLLALGLAPFIVPLQTTIPTVYAESGSAKDIQAAVDAVAAVGGGTVYVPSGNFAFAIDPNQKDPIDGRVAGVIIIGGVNVIGMGKDETVLYQPGEPPYRSTMFFIDGRNQKPTRISGFTFRGNVPYEDVLNSAITIYHAKDYRIDHCRFIDFSNAAMGSQNFYGEEYICRGLIDHCDIENPYKDDSNIPGKGPDGQRNWAYGIYVGGTRYNWDDLDNLLGRYDVNNVVYVEDCTFSHSRHAIASNMGGYYVVRHCTFREARPHSYGHIDIHGEPEAPYVGGRGLEAYNNTVYFSWDGAIKKGVAFWIRGGGGVIYNNKIMECPLGIGLYKESTQEKTWVKDLWIWNNVMQGVATPLQSGDYKEEVDYFLRQRPGYTPYPYPHPLAGGPSPPPTIYIHPEFQDSAKVENDGLKSQGLPYIITETVSSKSHMTVQSVVRNEYNLSIVLEGTSIETFQVFCNGYGEPLEVINTTILDYAEPSQTLTLEVQFSSEKTIIVKWAYSLDEPPIEQPVSSSSEPNLQGEPSIMEIQITLVIVGFALVAVSRRRKWI